jgi:hypothetical protein
MKQTDLTNYFSTSWHPRDDYQYSGPSLADKIQPNESVLDVGCGHNLFKGKIEKLIGIDPAFDQADKKCTIEEYQSEVKFDVAFCLGSINFGNEDHIINQISCVVQLLQPKSRIYWRCNPGHYDHDNNECKEIDFYPWSREKHIKLSTSFGYRLVDILDDSNNRLYAEWSRIA